MADPGPHHFLQYSQELQHWKASHLKFTTGSGNCVIAKARQARTDLFLSSFPIFSSLPIELRLRIWRLFNVPAVLTWNNNHHFGAGGPVTLYVNRESRHEALRTYTKFTAPLALTDLSPMSYFNFDIDVIYNDGYSPSSVVPAFAPMIKRYAVGLKEVVPEMPVWFVRLYMEQRIAKFWIQIAENFPNLEELIIITDPYPVCDPVFFPPARR
jgi:hypothetical protein